MPSTSVLAWYGWKDHRDSLASQTARHPKKARQPKSSSFTLFMLTHPSHQPVGLLVSSHLPRSLCPSVPVHLLRMHPLLEATVLARALSTFVQTIVRFVSDEVDIDHSHIPLDIESMGTIRSGNNCSGPDLASPSRCGWSPGATSCTASRG